MGKESEIMRKPIFPPPGYDGVKSAQNVKNKNNILEFKPATSTPKGWILNHSTIAIFADSLP